MLEPEPEDAGSWKPVAQLVAGAGAGSRDVFVVWFCRGTTITGGRTATESASPGVDLAVGRQTPDNIELQLAVWTTGE